MNILKITMNDVKDQVNMIYTEMIYNKYTPDLILGVQLGGLVPALMLAKKFNVRAIGSIRMGDMGRPIFDSKLSSSLAKKILIIDDICDSGKTMHAIFHDLPLFNKNDKLFSSAALIYKVHTSTWDPTFKGMTTDSNAWIQYPWEWNDEI